MPTDTDIGNMALSRMGTRATITSLTENSIEARVLNVHFATVRDSILRARNWNFARITQALSLSGTAPTRWTYSYAYPAGCLRFLKIDLGVVTQGYYSPHRYVLNPTRGFELGSDGTNRFILTDIAEAVGIFVQQVTDPNRWDPEFTTCFVDALAAASCFAITQKRDLAVALGQTARLSLENAAAESANEDDTPGWANFEADSILARG